MTALTGRAVQTRGPRLSDQGWSIGMHVYSGPPAQHVLFRGSHCCPTSWQGWPLAPQQGASATPPWRRKGDQPAALPQAPSTSQLAPHSWPTGAPPSLTRPGVMVNALLVLVSW